MINELIKANEGIVTALGWTLLHSIWQISLVALLLFIFLRICKSSSTIKYNISAAAILLIPITATITFLFYLPSSAKAIPEDYVYISFAEGNIIEPTMATVSDQITTAVNNYSSFIVILWFSGIIILLIRFAGGLFYTNQLRKSGIITVNETIISAVENFRIISGIKRQIKIFESVLVMVPVTIGYLKPLILLPAGTIAGIPSSQLEAILAHEIAHIKRWDYLHNLINTFIEIIFFYHPAIWWITERINQERENCCDDLAISMTGDSAGLARALAGLNQTFIYPKHILAMTGKQNHLLERIKRLAGIKESTTKLSYQSHVFLIITALVAGIALSVNASIQIPDSFMKTSHSIMANNLIDVVDEVIIQDTLKTKKRQLPAPAKVKKMEFSDDLAGTKKKELSDAERAKLEAEMKKLALEMEKLDEQMRELHKQMGFTEWDNFDFDFNFDFDTDSIRIKINKDLEKELAQVRIYTDQALKEARAGEVKAHAIAKEHAAKARTETKSGGKHVIIIEKEKVEAEKSKAKAKKLKMKAESEQLEEELRKDGLISGEHFSLKLDNTGMYIDGKKLSDEHYKKYRKIIMSDFEDEDEKFLEDSKFNIIITK